MRKFTLLFTFLICSIYIGAAQAPPTVTGTTTICSGSNTTLSATGDPGATFAWYDASSGGNLLSSSFELSTGSLTSTIHFYVEQTVGANTSPRADVVVTVTPIPSPLSPTNLLASPAIICEGESTDLSATVDAANNQKVHWYDAASGGNLLGVSASGSPFTVSPTSTTTYYAQSQIEVINTTFNYTGNVQTFTVPAGVTSIEVDAYGAEGGNTYSTTGSGKGGRVQATLSVTPGQVLNIYVGGQGQSYAGYSGTLAGGWNGGARGSTWGQGAGGGGATDIRINGTATTDRVLVAGGAGGKGPTCTNTGFTPHGGGLTGASGSYCNTGPAEGLRGRGGSPTAGGRAGCWWSGSYCGGTGSFGSGGVGGDYYGAGGGGGWYGGGGSVDRGDGGGGSSYTDPSLCSNVTHTQGTRSGHGLLAIAYSLGIDCANTNREPVTVTVTPLPTVVASSDVYICPGVDVSISASGADTYSWEPGSLSGASITVAPSVTTTYTVVGTTATGGCTASDQVVVTISDVVASADQAICENGSATLTASGAVTYTWEPGSLSGSSVSVTPSTTTTYTVTGHDPSGCTTTDDVTVTVNPNPIVTASNDTVIVNGTSANLTASGADTYTWSPGSLSGANVSVSPSTTTTYTLTGRYASTNCPNTDQVTVGVVSLPSIVGITTVLLGESTSLTASGTGGATFEWYDAETGGNLLSSDPTLTTSNLTQNSVFYVALNDGVNTSPRMPVNVTAIDSTLVSVGAAEASICPGSGTDLGASLNSPGVINWYDDAAGTNLIGTTDPGVGLYVTPATTTTYYAKGITQEKVVTFNYTGGVQTFTVPAGVTSIDIDAYGAQGGNSYSTSGPGLGGRVQATMNVTPGQILHIYVGGQGQSYAGYGSQLLGGWNGGGHGTNTGQGGGGGGATDIRIAGTSLNDRVLVAGGAGGKSPVTCTLGSSAFPHGGGLTGAAGSYCTGGAGEAKRGLGGSQTAGGRPGCWYSGTSCAGGGSFGYGGTGGSVSGNGRAGGGGGGWYGGGGGTYNSDGGGGSSYVKTGLCHNVVHTQGVRSGHGVLVLTYSKNSINNTLSPTSVAVEDFAAPVPNIPSLPDAQGDAPVSVSPPAATDVCAGVITATTTDPTTYYTMGTYTIQWDYDDGNGNFSSQNQTIIVNTTLPVELTSFTAKCEGQKVILKWITESEINSSHFEVQRSKDGIHWESFGRIPSAGDSQVTQNYQFTELSRFDYSLYRLMQVDIDGTTANSNIISTDCGGTDTKVNIYPNPSNGDFSVSFQGEGEETLELSILDELGLVLESKNIQLSNGWQQTTFSLRDYPTGFYKLQVKGQYHVRTYRVIKIQE